MKRFMQWLLVLSLMLFLANAASAHSATLRSAAPQKDPGLLHPETLKAKAPAEFDAKFVTTKGDFVIHVTRAWSPLGADRF